MYVCMYTYTHYIIYIYIETWEVSAGKDSNLAIIAPAPPPKHMAITNRQNPPKAASFCFSFNFIKGHFSIFHWLSGQNGPFLLFSGQNETIYCL